MAKDYIGFFNLTEDPFGLTPDPGFFFPSLEHNEILASLEYAVEQKEGFSVICGEPGTGKTTILRILVNKWKEKAVIALIMTPRLSPEEFLQALLEDIGVKVTGANKNELVKAFRDLLVEHASLGKRVIVIVDEAQDLPDETLEELRLLSNLETEKEKLLQIILVGQSELREKLRVDHLKQLDQRISIRATLKPLSRGETADYINYRIIKAGKGTLSFDEKARQYIHALSKGVPRVINLLASRAVMAAYVEGSFIVSRRHVTHALKHLADIGEKRERYRRLVFVGLLVVVIVIAIGMVSYVTYTRLHHDSLANVAVSAKGIEKAAQGQEKTVIVKATAARLRKEPSLDADVVTFKAEGSKLKVVGEFSEPSGKKWFKIRLPEGPECWIAGKAVEAR